MATFDLSRLQPVANRVIHQYYDSGRESLEPRDFTFYLIWSYALLDNGGHASFFYNSMADNYDETVEALRSLGMEDFARLLERAAEALFHGPVPRTLEERNEIIDALPEDDSDDAEDDLFDELNGEYFAKGGGDRALAALERWYFGDARPATA